MDNSLRIESITSEATGGNVISYFGKLNDETYFAFSEPTSIGIYDAPYPTHVEDTSDWEKEHLIRMDSDIEEQTFTTYCEELCRKATQKDFLDCLALMEIQRPIYVNNDTDQLFYTEFLQSIFGVATLQELSKIDADEVNEKAKQFVASWLFTNF